MAADLTSRGYIVSLTSPEAPYDLVAERTSDHRLFRIQVKAAYEKGGKLVFSTSRTRPRHAPRLQYEVDAFDEFAVVASGEGICYVPHGEDTPRSARTVSDDLLTRTEPGT